MPFSRPKISFQKAVIFSKNLLRSTGLIYRQAFAGRKNIPRKKPIPSSLKLLKAAFHTQVIDKINQLHGKVVIVV